MVLVTEHPAEFTLDLTEQERDSLATLLEQMLQNKSIEVHRTDALEYKQFVMQQETLLKKVVARLRQSPTPQPSAPPPTPQLPR